MKRNKNKIDMAYVPEIMKCIQLLDKTYFCFKGLQDAIESIILPEESEIFAIELVSIENKLKTALTQHDYQV